ncbi:conserved hypothetical protein [Leishmania major strain Friedlin]|uniref:Uncharacterized protein n=1 Tax=Leishmania major TaxID=5664 RepID=E9AE19_LEIMA|nr:conserved hypothetical protein [Leishmania major strain Friedlin]CAG9577898.1 hypothetical_protein_-_conserved [Leishmania major strain Friedlin]CBZ12498.1 conserved hypothetical protein [Leishmania major strain Friedlin]|eukprot:XP_003722240.1 conserved hypothetical protein [Leishmania major strain Friedlin]
MQGAKDTPTANSGGKLQIRTTLLEAVRRYNEDCLNTSTAAAAAEEPLATPTQRVDRFPDALPRMIAQLYPSLTNPSWAMEECVRLCPAAEVWCGTALPKDVWAPPGTAECPFGTEPMDFNAHR